MQTLPYLVMWFGAGALAKFSAALADISVKRKLAPRQDLDYAEKISLFA